MSYQCPTCGSWRSCWSPEIFDLPTMPSSEQVAGGGGVEALEKVKKAIAAHVSPISDHWLELAAKAVLTALSTQRDDGAMVSDAMVERAREAYFAAAAVDDGVFTNAEPMRAALEAAQAAPQQDDTPQGGET